MLPYNILHNSVAMATGSLLTRKKEKHMVGNSLTSQNLKPIYRVIILSDRNKILKTKGSFNQIFQWTVENVIFCIYIKNSNKKVGL